MVEMLAEHAAAAEAPVVEQPPELQSVQKMVNQFLERSRRAQHWFMDQYHDNYRFFNGSQWPIARPNYRFSEVINTTWANIMTETGIQSDSKPQVDYVAAGPEDFQFAELLKQINDANWAKSSLTGHGWPEKVYDALLGSKIYKVMHALVEWKPELEDGLGDTGFEVLNPYYCFWDPLATNTGELKYFIYAEPVPTDKLKNDYPEHRLHFKPDLVEIEHNDPMHRVDVTTDRFRLTTSYAYVRSDRDPERYGGQDMTLFVRCWVMDEAVEEVEEQRKQEDGNVTKEFVQKKKFPKGRYIEMANNIVLADRENGVVVDGEVIPYEDGKIPVARCVNYQYPGEYVGEDEVTQQRGPGRITNYIWSHMLDQMKKGASPLKKLKKRSGIDPSNITDEPGLVVELNDPNDLILEFGQGVAPGMQNLLDSAMSIHSQVQGLQDSSKGAPQPGVTSGLMLEGFVEAAQTRPRLKNRNLEAFLREVGYLQLSRYLQFYTQPRVFRLTNEGEFPEFVEFFVKPTEQGLEANVQKSLVQPDGVVTEPVQTMQAKGIPDVRISTGSALPFARAQKTATALDLQSRGAITLESLLKSINWPNAEEEAKKVAEEQQAAAEAQAQQEGMVQ